MPTLEEIQQTLNKAVDCIVSTMKGVGQWSKERLSKVWVYVLQRGLLINGMQFWLLKSKVFFSPHSAQKKLLERKMLALRNEGGSDSETEMKDTEVGNQGNILVFIYVS